MKLRSITTACALLLLGATSLNAKTLVYCSEGSPENFNPMFNTTGTTFDANVPIYNRLVEFKIGTTEIGPGAGRELGRSRRTARPTRSSCATA